MKTGPGKSVHAALIGAVSNSALRNAFSICLTLILVGGELFFPRRSVSVYIYRERERERETETERQRERQRQTDRQTGRQARRQRQRVSSE